MSPSTPPPPASPSPASRSAPSAPPTVGRVLVIDDDAMFATAMVRTLDKEHQVTCSTSAAAALAAIRDGQRFDVILCDLTMPEMSGLEFFDTLQRSHADQASKIIFLTGGGFTPRVQRFLEETLNLTLEKPFAAPQLRDLVNQRVSAVRGWDRASSSSSSSVLLTTEPFGCSTPKPASTVAPTSTSSSTWTPTSGPTPTPSRSPNRDGRRRAP